MSLRSKNEIEASSLISRSYRELETEKKFGRRVFNSNVMEHMLPEEVQKNIRNAKEGIETIKVDYADMIALAMKEWAQSHGATHYCHWFQPLTGFTAEKHDSFIDWKTSDSIITKFSGKQLIQGEPDASSFPSGGLRVTYEARGYTGWDPSSNVFIWQSGEEAVLCIPSVFFSWTGQVLDNKIPLLRSDYRINQACLRLLALTKTPANRVFSTLGWEQEYFIIDQRHFEARPDLVLLEQTIYGAPSPKGQDLQDHYFGAVKERIISFMKEVEDSAIELGIPVKTRHNEVAPAQHEVAAVFEKASRSVDHNLLMMQIMRQIAAKHGLACIMKEKPFAELNGSGKHNNWSLATDSGLNLLDPTDTPENSIQFLILLTAILHAVHKHASLLRASVACFGNDFRLGGHEAPPAIISVHLGDTLEQTLDAIEKNQNSTSLKQKPYNLQIPTIPDLPKDNTDRNRTSPFAFTGNKFEFRAVGSSQSCSFPITVINCIVAESLEMILHEIESELTGDEAEKKSLNQIALPVIRKYIIKSKPIRFSGDNYSESWVKEAKKRQLPNIPKSIQAIDVFKDKKTEVVFNGILTPAELQSRYLVQEEELRNTINIFTKLHLQLFYNDILPAVIKYQSLHAKALLRLKELGLTDSQEQYALLSKQQILLNQALKEANELEEKIKNSIVLHNEESKQLYVDDFPKHCSNLRRIVDEIEEKMDRANWPLPSYWEMLFLV